MKKSITLFVEVRRVMGLADTADASHMTSLINHKSGPVPPVCLSAGERALGEYRSTETSCMKQ